MKYLILIFLIFFAYPVLAVDNIKTIGTDSRDYSTIQLWADDLDDGTTAVNNSTAYGSGDTAIGEIYNDSAFDEDVSVTLGGTVGLGSITLTVPSSERHDGTAGTGARIVRSTGAGAGVLFSVLVPTPPFTLEWFEIDGNDQDINTLYNRGTSNSSVQNTVRNTLMHNIISISSGVRGISGSSVARDIQLLNNIVYNIHINRAGGGSVYGIHSDHAQSWSAFLNNTIYNVGQIHVTSAANAFGLTTIDVNTGLGVVNNIIVGTFNNGVGTATDFDPATPSTIDMDHNLSSDTTASGTGSLTSKTAANQFVSTTGGSEDLHLKTGADAIDAGTDLGTTPTGVNIDIDGRDRDAEGDTWDMGAHEFISGAPADTNATGKYKFLKGAWKFIKGAWQFK